MPFKPPPETVQYWQTTGASVATDQEISMLEAHLNGKAPASYSDFMKTFGNVEFDDDINCRFDYIYEEPDRTERRSQVISFIKSPQQALRYYDGLQKDNNIDLPPHLLPFGMDYGQGELLIELGRPTERIFLILTDSVGI